MLPPTSLLRRDRLAALFGARDDGPPVGGSGVAWDNRRVRPGDVFFALPGANSHGLEHAADALARGAAFVVSDRPWSAAHSVVRRPPRTDADLLLVDDAPAALAALGRDARSHLRSPVVGITGSVGKTTTKAMVTATLAARSTPGNLNTVPALVAALVQAAWQDLDAQQHAGVANPAASDATSSATYGVPSGALTGPGGPGSPVVLELGIDRPGEMAELLALCRPDHGIVTTIGESHLAALDDVAGVAREKTLLLASVPGQRLAGPGVADHLSQEVAARTTFPSALFNDDGGLLYDGESLQLPWPGRALAENALLALTLAASLGIDRRAAVERLLAAELEPGRLRRFVVGERQVIDDSYNANPLSVALALEVLRGLPAPRVAILGDMRELGAVSRQRHLELGSATRDLDLVIAVGPEAAAIGETNPAALTTPDAAGACALLGQLPRSGTVLVKGSRSLGLERVVAALETGSWETESWEAVSREAES